jgi:5-methylcytosine-specific restriction endonuclease McrA
VWVVSSEWLTIMRSTDWKCFYCGKSISSKKHRTIDHIVAVTKNGPNNILNLVPCCRSCNSSKGDRDVFDWIKYKNLELSEHKLRIIGGIK